MLEYILISFYDKKNNMDSDDKSEQEKTWYDELSDSEFSEPIWVRYFGLQTNTINKGLLDYNVYTICICCPILYFIFYLL
jgi:hypothetical protein